MRTSLFAVALALPLLGLATACRTPEAAATTDAVDSVRARAVELAEFRAGLAEPAGLAGGAPSRDALVRSFVRAMETRDTATLRRLTLTRAEFAWLYYPTNPEAGPPYDLSPALMWFLLESRGRQGLVNLLDKRAGAPLGYAGLTCDTTVSVQGVNRVTGPCVLQRRLSGGAHMEDRLFGLIIERNGRFKFVNYANRLD